MKTLLVGDIHLKARFILPMVEEKVKEEKCQQVILLGDYVDFSRQKRNTQLYVRDLLFLMEWKKKMLDKGVEVITLIGNHDAPYLIDIPAHYSTENEDLFLTIGDSLYEMGLQVAYQLGDYLVSHAGITKDFEVEDWYFKPVIKREQPLIEALRFHVSTNRGGKYPLGSPIWADFVELKEDYNPKYPKQIVGHTPQKAIDLTKKRLGIDTFSMDFDEDGLRFIGNGDLLLYEAGNLEVLSTHWQTEKIKEEIYGLLEK